MSVAEYFARVRRQVEMCSWAESSHLAFDERTTFVGYVRGEIYFIDQSVLHLREFIDTEQGLERLAYAYQYMRAAKQMVFRYDNAEHHHSLGTATYPHLKHDGIGGTIVSCSQPDLDHVLSEIGRMILQA